VAAISSLNHPGETEPVDPEAATSSDPVKKHMLLVTRFRQSLCSDPRDTDELASTMVHEAFHNCRSINFSYTQDPYGRTDREVDECNAYAAELKCGFHPKPNPRQTGCFFFSTEAALGPGGSSSP
jgi:hypothetical protein